jgi:hypothetical protein
VVTGDLNVVESGQCPGPHQLRGLGCYAFYDSSPATASPIAFRHLQPPRGGALLGSGRSSGAGYRFYHLFVDHAHSAHIVDCRYDHQPRRAVCPTTRRSPQ